MTTINRTYYYVGTTSADLTRYVDPVSVIVSSTGLVLIASVTNDPDSIESLDEQMAIAGYSSTLDPTVAYVPVLGEMIEICGSSAPGSIYGNGVQFVPLRQGQADTVNVEFLSSYTGDIEVCIGYAMSAANSGVVAIRMDFIDVTAGVAAGTATNDPSAAFNVGTPATFVPGNDTLYHVADHATYAGFQISGVTRGDYISLVIQRPTAGDTNTADLRILKACVRGLT